MKRIEFIKNLNSKDIKDLTKELTIQQEKLVTARLDLGLGKLKNYSCLSQNKRDIARIQTILSQKADELIFEELSTKEEK